MAADYGASTQHLHWEGGDFHTEDDEDDDDDDDSDDQAQSIPLPRRSHLNYYVQQHFVTADVSKLGEYEFKIISELNAQLIVHHPYRDLADLREPLSLTQDEYALSWSVVNDHYLTFSPLLYPPNVIAAASVVIVVTVRPSQTVSQARPGSKGGPNSSSSSDGYGTNSTEEQCKTDKLAGWLAQEKFDMEVLAECTQSLLSLYKSLEDYSEWDCKDKVGRIVKALPQAKV
ncbi:MAG: RNA polymerase II holoenzyme cyclin-like subunit [Alyxoria varia]|nr:MAG: RNA polymerase II holoenzyme cyclin-like subunit [Alyxoria varia]